jgi:predicted NAD-dependent protein-ADP-ribosyltransferase YbiA (DUF1768 family)
MTQPQTLAPKPKAITINGQPYNLVAFYYPGSDTAWDLVFQAQFLANFYECSITLTIQGITATFNNSEAAFQATKWWDIPKYRTQFEATTWPRVTGAEAFNLKKGFPDSVNNYAGLGPLGAMKAVLTAKFSDPVLQQALLDTGDAYLLEHNVAGRKDPGGWSDLHDGRKVNDPLGTTLNGLGKTLMEVRQDCGGVGAPSGTYAVADFSAHAEK